MSEKRKKELQEHINNQIRKKSCPNCGKELLFEKGEYNWYVCSNCNSCFATSDYRLRQIKN